MKLKIKTIKGRARTVFAWVPQRLAILTVWAVWPALQTLSAADAPPEATLPLPEEPIYARLAAPLPQTGSAIISLKTAERIITRVTLSSNSPRRCEARIPDGALLWSTEIAPDTTQLEFSNTGGVFRLYTDHLLLGSITNADSNPAVLTAAWPNVQPRISVQRMNRVKASDDFMRDQIAKDDAWFIQSGLWKSLYDPSAEGTPNPFVAMGQAEHDPAILLTGHVAWNNLRLTVAMQPKGTGSQGLVFGYRDPSNYLAAAITRPPHGIVELLSVRDGKRATLASQPLRTLAGRWLRMEVTYSEDSAIRIAVDDSLLLSGPSNLNTFGKVGLYTRLSGAVFDDFTALSWPPATPQLPPLVIAASRQYSVKESTPHTAAADAHLFRWAKDLQSWFPFRAQAPGMPNVSGHAYRLPVSSDFSLLVPAPQTPGHIVLKHWDGSTNRVYRVPAGAEAHFSRQGPNLMLGETQMDALPPGRSVYVGYAPDTFARSRKPSFPELRCNGVRHELFDSAPVDWLPLSGLWEITNRWKCEPGWKFFAGVSFDAAILMSKTRFDGNQSHEFYFALKDLFDREYNRDRYTRHDINFSFCNNGRDLFSGYTVMYGGFGNQASYLFRGRECVATNTIVKFQRPNPEPGPRIYDEHLYWRRIRVDRVENRIRAYLEDRPLFDYPDPSPLPADGHIALWTMRNGVMWARVDSSARRVQADAGIYLSLPTNTPTAHWTPLEPDLVNVTPDGNVQSGHTRVENLFGGGAFAVRALPAQQIDLGARPLLNLWMDVPENVQVSLHFRVNEQYFIHTLTAPTNETYRILGDPSAEPGRVYPEWKFYVSDPLDATRITGAPVPRIKG